MTVANGPPQISRDPPTSGAVVAEADEQESCVLAHDGAEAKTAGERSRERKPAPAAELELEPVRLQDPGALLRGPIELRCELGELESAAWVEYQACPAATFAWQPLARSEAAPFSARVDSAGLPDGAYDMRVLVGRREGPIECSRPLRRRFVENTASVSLRQPAAGAWVGDAVALAARFSPAAAELGPIRFQFSTDGQGWRPMLRAARAGAEAAIWYTTGLADGDYLVRALAGGAAAQAASEPVPLHLDNTPPLCRLLEPRKFAVLRGSVRLLAEALDAGSGVAAVEFEYARAAGAWTPLGSTALMPFSLLWATQGLPEGAYRLRCLARDCIGNRAASEPVAVLVANAARPERPSEAKPPVPQAEQSPRTPGPRPPEPLRAGPGPPRLREAMTLWHLERLVSEQGGSDPHWDERNALLYALRAVAEPDGTIPKKFWSLLAETFGELVANGEQQLRPPPRASWAGRAGR